MNVNGGAAQHQQQNRPRMPGEDEIRDGDDGVDSGQRREATSSEHEVPFAGGPRPDSGPGSRREGGDRANGEPSYVRREFGNGSPDVMPRRFRDGSGDAVGSTLPRESVNALPNFLGLPSSGSSARPQDGNGNGAEAVVDAPRPETRAIPPAAEAPAAPTAAVSPEASTEGADQAPVRTRRRRDPAEGGEPRPRTRRRRASADAGEATTEGGSTGGTEQTPI